MRLLHAVGPRAALTLFLLLAVPCQAQTTEATNRPTANGYICPPCGCEGCGTAYENPGTCPASDCGMRLVPSSPDFDGARSRAEAAWTAQDWPAAASALHELVAQDPTDGDAWYRLGYALHAQGHFDEALQAHVKAAEFPASAALGAYNAACVYALQGDMDQAFAWLARAVAAGFDRRAHAEQDTDLEPLRDDARFAEFLISMENARTERGQRNVAILVHEGIELLDFAGPGEVFSAARLGDGSRAFQVYLVAESREPVTSQGFVHVTPQYTFDDCPGPDLIVLPGGATGRALRSEPTMRWIEDTAPETEVVLSVCTGALMLAQAELLDGLTATTHHGSIDSLKRMAPGATVTEGARYVDNGRYVTSAGVSAGIDGALHVVMRLLGRQAAIDAAWYMEYDWTPEEDASSGLVIKR